MKLSPLKILLGIVVMGLIGLYSVPQHPPVYRVAFDTPPSEIARAIVRAHRHLKKTDPSKKHPIREPLEIGMIIADPPIQDDRWRLVMKCLTTDSGDLKVRTYVQ